MCKALLSIFIPACSHCFILRHPTASLKCLRNSSKFILFPTKLEDNWKYMEFLNHREHVKYFTGNKEQSQRTLSNVPVFLTSWRLLGMVWFLSRKQFSLFHLKIHLFRFHNCRFFPPLTCWLMTFEFSLLNPNLVSSLRLESWRTWHKIRGWDNWIW